MIELTTETIWAWQFHVGRILIDDTLPLINIGLFRWSVSSSVSFGSLCVSKNWSVSSVGHHATCEVRRKFIKIYYLFNVHVLRGSSKRLLILVSDTSDLYLLSCFRGLAWLEVYWLKWPFQRISFWFCWFISVLISCFIDFHSFIISFLLALGYIVVL